MRTNILEKVFSKANYVTYCSWNPCYKKFEEWETVTQQKIWIENSLVLNNQYILNQTAGSGSVSISKNWHFYSSKRNPYTYKNHVQYLGIPLLYLFKPCLYKKCKYNVNLNSLCSNQYLYPHSCKSSIWSWKLLSIKTFLNFSYTDWEEDLPDQSIESERHQQTSEPLGNLIHCQLRCS